jgi:hypothetical protein
VDRKRYRHRCQSCTSLKSYGEYDLYLCPRPLVVARLGNRQGDERTPRCHSNEEPVTRETRTIAEEQRIETEYQEYRRQLEEFVGA